MYVGDKKVYVGDKKVYVGDKKVYVGDKNVCYSCMWVIFSYYTSLVCSQVKYYLL